MQVKSQTGLCAHHCRSLSWALLNPVLVRVRKVPSPRWTLTGQEGRGSLKGQTRNSVWPKQKLACIGTALTLCPSSPDCFFHLLQYCIQKWWCSPSWQLSETGHLHMRRRTYHTLGEQVSIVIPSLTKKSRFALQELPILYVQLAPNPPTRSCLFPSSEEIWRSRKVTLVDLKYKRFRACLYFLSAE